MGTQDRGWGVGRVGIAELGRGRVSWVRRGGSIGEEVGTQDRDVGGGGRGGYSPLRVVECTQPCGSKTSTQTPHCQNVASCWCPRGPKGRYVDRWGVKGVARSGCTPQTRLRIMCQERPSVRIQQPGNRPNPKIALLSPKRKLPPLVFGFASKLASCRTRWRAGIVEADSVACKL